MIGHLEGAGALQGHHERHQLHTSAPTNGRGAGVQLVAAQTVDGSAVIS